MKLTPKKIRFILIGIVTFSIAIKLLFVFVDSKHLSPQLLEYEHIASNVLSGTGFVTSHLGTNYYTLGHPLYPLLCVVLYYFTNHSYLAVLVMQILEVSLLCALIFFIAKRQVGSNAGLLAAFLVALHPGLFIYSTSKLHPLPTDAFLFAAFVLISFKIKENPTLKLSILGGLVLGICALTRSTILVFFLIAAVWFLSQARVDKKKAAISMVIMGIFAFLTILPWSIRNYKVYKRPVLILNNFGLNLWIGNNLKASGSALTREGKPFFHALPEDKLRRLFEMNEIQQGDFLKNEAFKFIKENPTKFFKLYLKKIFYFWWFSPQSGLEYPKKWLKIYKIFYAIILIFFALGLHQALYVGKSNEAVLITILFLVISAIQALFFVEGRHRWAIEPFMMVYVAAGAQRVTFLFSKYLNLPPQH